MIHKSRRAVIFACHIILTACLAVVVFVSMVFLSAIFN